MATDFIPAQDANALIWMQAFGSGIQSSPATYELTAVEAANIATAVQEFADALALASAPLTRTPGNVEAKDTKRNAAESLCRQYAIQIKYNNGITDQAKIDIGVRPVNTDREPIYVPMTSPLATRPHAGHVGPWGAPATRLAGTTPGEQRARGHVVQVKTGSPRLSSS